MGRCGGACRWRDAACPRPRPSSGGLQRQLREKLPEAVPRREIDSDHGATQSDPPDRTPPNRLPFESRYPPPPNQSPPAFFASPGFQPPFLHCAQFCGHPEHFVRVRWSMIVCASDGGCGFEIAGLFRTRSRWFSPGSISTLGRAFSTFPHSIASFSSRRKTSSCRLRMDRKQLDTLPDRCP